MYSPSRTISQVALVAGIALGAIAFAPSRTRALAAPAYHLRLVKSEPSKGDSVSAPKVLRLWFSEPATLSVTSIKLKAADDTEVPLGKPTFSGSVKDPVEATITGVVAAGTYVVSYKTASRDMHPITGDFSFVVR